MPVLEEARRCPGHYSSIEAFEYRLSGERERWWWSRSGVDKKNILAVRACGQNALTKCEQLTKHIKQGVRDRDVGTRRVTPTRYGYCHGRLCMQTVMLSTLTRRTLASSTRPRPCFRAYASVSSSAPPNPNTVGPFQVFDRNAKRLQKNGSAAKDGGETSRIVDYVRDEVADRMMERLLVSFGSLYCHVSVVYIYILYRLQDIKRKFNTILDLGSGPGHFSKLLETTTTSKVTMLDSSGKLLLLQV